MKSAGRAAASRRDSYANPGDMETTKPLSTPRAGRGGRGGRGRSRPSLIAGPSRAAAPRHRGTASRVGLRHGPALRRYCATLRATLAEGPSIQLPCGAPAPRLGLDRAATRPRCLLRHHRAAYNSCCGGGMRGGAGGQDSRGAATAAAARRSAGLLPPPPLVDSEWDPGAYIPQPIGGRPPARRSALGRSALTGRQNGGRKFYPRPPADPSPSRQRGRERSPAEPACRLRARARATWPLRLVLRLVLRLGVRRREVRTARRRGDAPSRSVPQDAGCSRCHGRGF